MISFSFVCAAFKFKVSVKVFLPVTKSLLLRFFPFLSDNILLQNIYSTDCFLIIVGTLN
jgi:hypothetical protein